MIDVIIPAYNAHKTIEQTLFSIVYQSISDNVNVYIVDDCSNKDYQEITDYFSNFLNIKLLKLDKNGGPGVARQFGIDNSNSKYIVFIDSDDVFSDCFALQNLYEEIISENYDIVSSSFAEEQKNGFFLHTNDRVWLHGKIYKREYLEKENIRFNESRANEDNGFNQMIFLGNSKVKYSDKKTYIWRNNYNSITRKRDREYNIKGLDGYIYNINYALEFAIKKEYDKNKIGELAYSTIVAMYYYYLEYQDKIKKLFKYCKKINKIVDKYPILENQELDIIEIQRDTMLTLENRKFILNPCITLDKFIDMIKSVEDV